MARKPAFTEQEVIEAAQALDENNKTLNGTNLRLEIGAGSPMKLMETYNKLLATGKIKLKSQNYTEELEGQLEAQLELLAQVEDKKRTADYELTLMMTYISCLESLVPFDFEFEETMLNIFSKERNKDENMFTFNIVMDLLEKRLDARKTYKALKDRWDYLTDNAHKAHEEQRKDLETEIASIELKMDIILKEHSKKKEDYKW